MVSRSRRLFVAGLLVPPGRSSPSAGGAAATRGWSSTISASSTSSVSRRRAGAAAGRGGAAGPDGCTASAAWIVRVASAAQPARVCSSARLIADAKSLFMLLFLSRGRNALLDAVLQGRLDLGRRLKRPEDGN